MRPGLTLVAGASALAVAGALAAQTPPPALVAKCAAARTLAASAPKSGGMLKTLGGGGGFSISGKGGVFLCSKEAAGRRAVDRGAAGGGMSLSAQADVRGSLRPTLFTMPETQKRLQAMVDRIADAWPYPDAPRPTVLISANVGFNAEARVDNTIIVWLGVFEGEPGQPAADLTDNDLYWLLGHEYSHLALQHAGRDEVGEGQRRMARDAARIYQRGAMLESTLRYSEATPLSGPARLEVRDARETHRRLRFLMDSVLYPSWGRAQEDEADVAGYDATVLAGLRPRTSLATGRFEASEKTREEQMAEVRGKMEARASRALGNPSVQGALATGALGPAFSSVATSLGKGLYEGLREQFFAWTARDHRSARQREEGLERYRATAYEKGGIELTGGVVRTETAALLALPELRQGLAVARAVADAQAALDADPADSLAATQKIAMALGSVFGREAYVRYWAARVDLAAGRVDSAIRHLVAARSSPNVSPEAYRELARLYTTSGRLAQAQAVVAEGRRKTGDSDYFLPEDVRILARQTNLAAVKPLLQRCRATEREQVMLDCQNAALDVDYASLSEAQKQELEDLAYWGSAEETPASGVKPPSLRDLRSLGGLLGG